MKKIKVLALCAIVAGFATSCQKEDVATETQEVVKEELSKSQIEALNKAGVNHGGAKIVTAKGMLPGDKDFQAIEVSDYLLSIEALERGDYALSSDDGINKQYRTNNLVTGSNRSFRVVGYTGSCCALTSKMRTALQWAVNNYNRLNTSLNLTLVFQSNFNNRDMVVYNNGRGGGGGSAGFPSGGQAFKRVQINAGTDSFSTNVVEHVMTHEIGHSVGFRHTDYARRKCDGSNEGTAGIGAILIPGTQSGNQWGGSNIDSNSIMISCFDGNEDGEFSQGDITALNALY
ncbi:M57 family metalloprotease [Aquimarina mytili]|uniref:Peptidase n=1 Tax=Aquimarina mytili TaxID=874423 RepID=A0A936ZTB4_9FLAO|nr:M57 family metalloprotease [Aquimarina mytili]MBL0685199.1 peptidase [Aquimarina mytili]